MKFSLVIPLAPYRKAEIVESIKKLEYPKGEIQVIIIKGINPSKNRNYGAERSSGEIIGFLDDDAIIEKDFLNKVDDFFNKYPEIDIVGGPQLTPYDETGFALISGYALSSKFGSAGSSARYKKMKLNLNADEKSLTSANLFVRREVMKKIRFDPNLWPGEDPKFIADAKKAGFKVAYCPDFVIYHRRRSSIKGLVKQIFNYGKARPFKESFLKTLRMPVFLIPMAFLFYLIVLGALFITKSSIVGNIIGNNAKGFLPHQISALIFSPLIAYLCLDLFFSVYEAIKNKSLKASFSLPIIYPLIHLSYGSGMIWGYINKFRKRK